MRVEVAVPIDPLCVLVDGRYEDDLVVVARRGGDLPRRVQRGIRTQHFDVVTNDGRLVVTHAVGPQDIDDDLAGIIADELFTPGWVRGSEMFERIFTGVVRTSASAALDSWELFYRNTIRRLVPGRHPASSTAHPAGGIKASASSNHGSIADYAPVHERAVDLVGPGSVLELGSCFGFLALRLAAAGHPTTASDVSAGTVRLLALIAPRLGVALDTLLADAARVPVGDAYADTVVAIHLLEHLEPEHGIKVVAEAIRCARRRVVIAVPLEHEAHESYGHLRTIGLDDLRGWGSASGLAYEVAEHHDGWLVLDKV
ncbi:MAG: mycofactocin oligosaccharide methyltransferase MftM [Lapillicoccus sp.]